MRSSTLVLGVLAAAAVWPSATNAQAPATLTDAEIAHVAVTANAIDVELAKVAETRAASPEVQAFARTMITDHTAVNRQAGELAQRLGVTPADNAVSASLRSAAEPVRRALTNLHGTTFDLAYIEREVAYHQAVLDALDQLLIPQTRNRELRALLEQVRPVIAAHLEHARRLDHGSDPHR
jgi:putative membrane protein